MNRATSLTSKENETLSREVTAYEKSIEPAGSSDS
jgi:hypothetical protein